MRTEKAFKHVLVRVKMQCIMGGWMCVVLCVYVYVCVCADIYRIRGPMKVYTPTKRGRVCVCIIATYTRVF